MGMMGLSIAPLVTYMLPLVIIIKAACKIPEGRVTQISDPDSLYVALLARRAP